MNWHFIFFLLDVLGWITIAVLLCSRLFVEKSKINLSILNKLNIILVTLFIGFLSVLINGIPNIGISIDSFFYVFIVSLILVAFLQTKTKKDYLPKISKRNKKVAYI